MKKLIFGLALVCATLGSDDPKDYDDRATFSGSLEGTWHGVSGEDNGQTMNAQIQGAKLVFKNDATAQLFDQGNQPQNIQYRLEPSRRPAQMDLMLIDGAGKGQTIKLIYSLEGNVLKMAITSGQLGMRPTEFKTGQGSNLRILIFKREGK
jgi:uncharacterized protein (TIGR03067 family)